MWCEDQRNGTVKYCERYTDPLTEKVKKITVTMPKDTPQNKNKAMRILNAKIEQAINETSIDRKIATQGISRSSMCDLQAINHQEELHHYKLCYKSS